MGVMTLPPVANVASRTPEVVYRARAKSYEFEPLPAHPAATILPSDWMATAAAKSSLDPMGVMTLPPVPNVGSRAPEVVYRARAKSYEFEPLPVYPAATILPSAWTATASATAPRDPKAA